MRTDGAAVVMAIAIAGCGTKGDSGAGAGASDRVKVSPGASSTAAAAARDAGSITPATVDAAPPAPEVAPDAGVAPPVSAGDRQAVAAGKDWPIVAGDVELGTGSRPFGATVVKP